MLAPAARLFRQAGRNHMEHLWCRPGSAAMACFFFREPRWAEPWHDFFFARPAGPSHGMIFISPGSARPGHGMIFFALRNKNHAVAKNKFHAMGCPAVETYLHNLGNGSLICGLASVAGTRFWRPETVRKRVNVFSRARAKCFFSCP